MQLIRKIQKFFSFEDAFICLLSFFASQRLLLPELSALCFIPIGLYALVCLFKEGKGHKFFALILAFFLAIADEGGGEFSYSPRILIRALIILLFFFFIARSKFEVSKKALPCLFLIPALIFYLLNNDTDLRVSYLCLSFSALIIIAHLLKSEKNNFDKNKCIIYTSLYIVPFIFGEWVNIFLKYFNVVSYEYLSYTSFKFIVITPLLLSALEHKYKIFFFLALLTFPVLLNYQTRTIFAISTIFSLFFLVESLIIQKKYLVLLGISGSVYTIFSFLSAKISSSSYKILTFFSKFSDTNFLNQGTIFDLMKSIDKYRYFENSLFFSQTIKHIFIGNGIGYKYPDSLNLTQLSNINSTAYSIEELQKGYIVSFHDSWTFFGNNFGLILYFYIIILMVIKFFKTNNKSSFPIIRASVVLILLSLFYSYTKVTTYFFIFFLAAFIIILRPKQYTLYDRLEKSE